MPTISASTETCPGAHGPNLFSQGHEELDPAPCGFSLIERGGPYFRMLGPTYLREDAGGQVLGLRISELHTNMQGNAHGGMLVTLADGSLNMCLSHARGDGGKLVTVNLATEFIGPARVGDWLEAHVVVRKMGMTMCFATCQLVVGTRSVMQASAIFAVVGT